MDMYNVYILFYFFRISKNFRNLYVVCFILATGQIFSLEGGGHKYIYSHEILNQNWNIKSEFQQNLRRDEWNIY